MAGYIAGIGGANVDIHGQSDAPIVMRDSNPGRLHLSAGGVCRNICDNLCRLGLTVELCSAVGGDAYGDMLRGACTAAGIGTRHLAVFPAQNTSAYISIMDSEGDMLVAMSDMHILKEALTPSYVEGLLPVLNGADVCVADANLSAGALETLATRCTVPLMLDPVSTAWARNAAPLAGYFHTLKPNLMEMEVLSGMRITNERELDAACGMLLEKGVYQVFVSLGREGLYFRRQGCGALRKKSRPFPMKNATGAGDATMAGIVYAWVNGLSPGDTLDFALGAGLAAIDSADTINPAMSPALVAKLVEYLSITPEISAAIRDGKPVVALESTILSHGMPYPDNLAFAAEVERIVRAEGAVPATMAIIDGVLKVGLTQDELELMCKGEGVAKVSRRDLPIMVAEKRTGATTVASTMILASLAGIRVFATGGIGGVHRGAEKTMDISADLQELRQTSVAVVCAGAKMILDIGLTLEYLETMGVPVLGLRTDDFPAFYCRRSGFGVDYNAKDEAEIARIAKTKWDLGLAGGILIGNPVPEEYAMDFDEMTAVIEKAIAGANAEGVRGKNITPYLLAHIVEYTGGQSLKTNIQLAYNNARAAGKIAVAYAKL